MCLPPELPLQVKLHRPDGLLGFSQGATAAALFLADLTQPEVRAQLEGVPPPGFGILIAPFVP